ncbi:DUF4340 domain-containing protein [Chlorogloeopsis sp. ULAP01]|uniref:DUF4340 domain-containing protein n=1 Tax=Chlorogloeopsis sp. ULAP01 TaxID=3056483 RepID=UPI0025AB3DA1|nr:DUF4340 domain-containing protein [Chlorogloeopsis sp. ULAP01]MDM9381371.1 DUF4340 domain-containing protein [Chlorogloeopsis sp. ULAP01]
MKLQRTTLILILLALSLGGFVYFYEFYSKTQQEEVQKKTQQIFSFRADDVQTLTVKTKDYTLNLERNKGSEQPQWLITSPQQAPASDAIVSYLMDLLVKGKSDRTLSIPADQLTEFGLVQPQATIVIVLKNQQTHQLTLGKPDFKGSFVYAQTNPARQSSGNVDVLLVSKDFENAVNRELSEWKQTPNVGEGKPLPSLNLPTPQN